jgi:hypothetical protein
VLQSRASVSVGPPRKPVGVVYGRAPANHANPVVRSFFNKQFGYDAIMAKQKREGGRGKGERPSVLLCHNLVEPQTRRSFRQLVVNGFVGLGLIVAGSNLEGPVTAAARSGF